jgi:hypothetical protein
MGAIFLFFFAATLFGLYIAIRRSWGDRLTTSGAGIILSVLFVVLYALTYENTSVGQALFSGVVAGLGFSIAVIIIASFFRANQPSADIKLVSHTQQEATQDGQRHDHRQTPE